MKSRNSLMIAALPLLAAACANQGGGYSDYNPAPVAGSYPEGPPPAAANDIPAGAPMASGAGYPMPGSAPVQSPVGTPDPQGMYPPDGGPGPRGSSRAAPGENRYDEAGYAVSTTDAAGFGPNVMYAASRALPVETFVEITSLDTGKIVLAKIAGDGPRSSDALIDLSPALASALGLNGGALPVRVRKITPTSQDQAAINAGRAAPPRIAAPQSILKVLRGQLPPPPAGVNASVPSGVDSSIPSGEVAGAKPAEPVAPQPQPVRRTGHSTPMRPATVPGTSYPAPSGTPGAALSGANYYVQIVALSNRAKAQAIADKARGYIVPGGGVYRVRLGPYPTRALADKARSAAASQGFPGARIYDTAR